jgi:hypothetical protein
MKCVFTFPRNQTPKINSNQTLSNKNLEQTEKFFNNNKRKRRVKAGNAANSCKLLAFNFCLLAFHSKGNKENN